MLRIYLLLLFVSFSLKLNATEISPDFHQIKLRDNSKMLHTSLLSFNYVPLEADWQALQAKLIRGRHEVLWFRYDLSNSSQKNIEVIFEIAMLVNDMSLFVCKENACKQVSQWGYNVAFQNIEHDQVTAKTRLNIEPGETTLISRVVTTTQYGVNNPILYSQRESSLVKQESNLIMGLIFGCLMALVFYNLLHLIRFYDKIQLIYVLFLMASIFNFEMITRAVSNYFGSIFFYELGGVPNLTSINLAAIFALTFNVMAVDAKKHDPIFYRLSFLLGSVFAGVILVTLASGHKDFLFHHWNVTYLSGFLYDIFAVTVLVRACRRGYRPAYFYLLALSFALIGIVAQILSLTGVLPDTRIWTYSLYIGICLEMVFLSLGIADKHNLEHQEHLQQIGNLNSNLQESNKSLESSNIELMATQENLKIKNAEIEEMNRNLENIVDERTRELRTVFHNIPQGVATLDEKAIISSFYSAHLEDIWQQGDLGGRSFIDFLRLSGISNDQINMIEETLKVIVGEDSLNFEANSDHFPMKLETNLDGIARYLDLTWNPELRDDTVTRVLVTITDNTARHQAELEAQDQKENLHIIGELVAASEKKIAVFFRSSEALFEESSSLLRDFNGDIEVLEALFVQAHTVKGGARTLGLSLLANNIHDLEQLFSEALNGSENIDQSKIQSAFAAVKQMMEKYTHCNFNLLGRKADTSEVRVNRKALSKMLEVVTHLTEKGPEHFSNYESELKALREELHASFAQTDRSLLETLSEDIVTLAKELSKPIPRLHIEASDCELDQSQTDVLAQCMVHLIRNSLDHGIESIEQRKKASKPSAGNIYISSSVDRQLLTLRLKDDGRGLAIKKLRELGLKKGIISEQASIGEISEVIFSSGASTAEKVSQISGRGVGMDAVRRFLEQSGGSIELELSSVDASCEYSEVEFVLTLPLVRIKLAS